MESSSRRLPLQVVVDTSFLMFPFQKGTVKGFFEQLDELLNVKYELVVLEPVLRELEELSKSRSPKLSRQAKSALELAKKLKVLSVGPFEDADSAILSYAKERFCVVATTDLELKKKLRKAGIPVVFVRALKKLDLDGELPWL